MNKFDINKIKPNSIILIYGKKFTGKSILINDIVKNIYSEIEATFIGPITIKNFCYEEENNEKIMRNIISEQKNNEENNEKIIQNIISEQKNNIIKQNKLIILDDAPIMYNTDSKSIKMLLMNNKQYKIELILSVQYPIKLMINPMTIGNSDYIFIFTENENEINIIYDNIFKYFLDKEIFINMYNNIIKEPHTCLVYDRTLKSNNIKDTLFEYKVNLL